MDVREFFIFHMFLCVIPPVIYYLPDNVTLKAIVQVSIFVICIPVLVYRAIQRRRMNWKWPGVNFINIIVAALLLIIYIHTFLKVKNSFEEIMELKYIMSVDYFLLFAFGLLNNLNVVRIQEAVFQADCINLDD